MGAKILYLALDGVTVIDDKNRTSDAFVASGSYLMYPWVNRLDKYHKTEFKDGAGLPLHGLYCSAPRRLASRSHD